jgi:hypothetical protein
LRRLAPATPILSVAVPVSLCGFSNSVARDELSSAADELGRPGRRLLAHSLAGVVVGCELQRAWPLLLCWILPLPSAAYLFLLVSGWFLLRTVRSADLLLL